jgi:hypothetical protein
MVGVVCALCCVRLVRNETEGRRLLVPFLDSEVYVCNLSSPFPSDQYYLISDTVTFVVTALVCLHDVSLMYACCEKCSWSWGRSALTMHMVQVMFSPVSVKYEVVLAGRNRSWEVHVHRLPSPKETRRGRPFVSSLTRCTEENAHTIYQTSSTTAPASTKHHQRQHCHLPNIINHRTVICSTSSTTALSSAEYYSH